MTLSPERAAVLLAWARARVREELGGASAVRPSEPWCEEPAATFVTLHWSGDGALHGCIGSLEAHRSLVADVAHSAVAAALYDPRAERITLADVDLLDFELSILSPLEPIVFTDERSAIAALRPGVDGVLFTTRHHRGTFLPAMWPRLKTPEVFMAELKRKAGYPAHAWGDDVRLWRYTVDKHVDLAPAAKERSA